MATRDLMPPPLPAPPAPPLPPSPPRPPVARLSLIVRRSTVGVGWRLGVRLFTPELMAAPAPAPPAPPSPLLPPFPPAPPVAWLSLNVLRSTVRVALNWTIAPP